MAITEAPKIVTQRLGYDDSHTLERYLATGGYEGLRKALTMTPEAVAAEVKDASLLGRGGAGFPAGVTTNCPVMPRCRRRMGPSISRMIHLPRRSIAATSITAGLLSAPLCSSLWSRPPP